MSRDGRFVAFTSEATNLVAGDTNGASDVFVHDRSTGITTRESISSGRAEANQACSIPQISADGRFVTFMSSATNVVPGVSGTQIYVRDRQLGLTTVASVSSDGTAANGNVFYAAISADGRFVTFTSDASNLVPGTPRSVYQIYTRDRTTGVTRLDSVSPAGVPGDSDSLASSISDDGRYVVYQSRARNLAPMSSFTYQVLLYDRSTGETTVLSLGPSGEGLVNATQPSISGDGRFVAFAARINSNSTYNFYLRDRQAAQTTIVLQNSGDSSVKLSSDGRFASYNRTYDNTRYVEVYDRSTGQITTLSPGLLSSPVEGNALAFDSDLPLVAGDTNGASDIFVTPVGADPGAPNPPTNLAYSLAASRLTLTWSPPTTGSAASGYLLEAGTQSHSTDAANFLTGSTDTQFSTPFASFGTFYVRVRAVNSAGVSVPSNEIILAPLVLPGAPTNLTASVSDVGVRLTWSPVAGAVTSYIIEAGSAPGGTDLANFNTRSTNTTFTATSVAAGTYYVRIRAAGGIGVGLASNEVSFTLAGGCPVPVVPTDLTRTVVGSSVTLSWAASAAASAYVLEAGSATGRADLLTVDLNSAATTFVATGVPAGTYFVRVRSKNGCGQSGPSNEAVVIVSPGR